MSKNKWSHLNDYRPDDSGNYIYQGEMLRYSGDRRRVLLSLWLPSVLSFVLLLWAGFFPHALISRHIAAIAGYIAAIIISCIAFYKLFDLSSRGADVPSYVCEKTLYRLPHLYLCTVAALAESLVSSVVLLAIGSEKISINHEAATIVIRSIAAAINVFLFFYSRKDHLSK